MYPLVDRIHSKFRHDPINVYNTETILNTRKGNVLCVFQYVDIVQVHNRRFFQQRDLEKKI